MADSNARDLIQLGDKMFSKKSQLDTLWQAIAEQTYPERADFTRTRVDGDEFCQDLYTSLPAQNRRDLADAIGALTRRKDRPWFEIKIQGLKDPRQETKDWLSWARDRQRTLLYTRRALFQPTMQNSDNDFVSFGNAVNMQAEDEDRSGIMVFMDCHLRDCAWAQDRFRQVNTLHRKFKESLRNIVARPGWGMAALSEAQKRVYEKDPYCEVEIRHCVMPSADYDAYLPKAKRSKHPFRSVYVNTDAQMTMREGGYVEFPYHVRRWRVGSQSAYGYSPAAMLGLVEARLLQSQQRVVMDAGERVVDPPSVATRDAVLGEVANYAGATTWLDRDYDERTGEALRFIETRANIPIGLEMIQDTRQILAAAWYINKLTLPQEGDMTAFEVNERIDEYIRTIGPAVEPFEVDNAALLDTHFAFLMRMRQFGPIESIPQELQGADTVYEFDGPVQLAYRRQKLMKAKEVRGLIAESLQIRPEAADNFDLDKIDRDAADYIGSEPGWIIPEEKVAAKREQRAQEAAQQQQMQQAAQLGAMAKDAIEAVPAAAQANQLLPGLLQGTGLDQAVMQ